MPLSRSSSCTAGFLPRQPTSRTGTASSSTSPATTTSPPALPTWSRRRRPRREGRAPGSASCLFLIAGPLGPSPADAGRDRGRPAGWLDGRDRALAGPPRTTRWAGTSLILSGRPFVRLSVPRGRPGPAMGHARPGVARALCAAGPTSRERLPRGPVGASWSQVDPRTSRGRITGRLALGACPPAAGRESPPGGADQLLGRAPVAARGPGLSMGIVALGIRRRSSRARRSVIGRRQDRVQAIAERLPGVDGEDARAASAGTLISCGGSRAAHSRPKITVRRRSSRLSHITLSPGPLGARRRRWTVPCVGKPSLILMV